MLGIVLEDVPSVPPAMKAYATKRGANTVMICLINKGAVDADIEVNVGMDGNAFAIRISGLRLTRPRASRWADSM